MTTFPQSPDPVPADPVPPLNPSQEKSNTGKTVLIAVGLLAIGCLCFACGIVFGIWAWETGDSWFAAVPPVLSLL